MTHFSERSTPRWWLAPRSVPWAGTVAAVELGAFSISIPVTDLARSRAYYEAFGFEVAGGDEEEQWLILRNQQTTIGLFAFEGMDFAEPMLTFNPGLGQDMSNPETFTDIREIRERLLGAGAGVEIDTDLDPDETGPASLGLHDPDGHPILIDQFRAAPGSDSD